MKHVDLFHIKLNHIRIFLAVVEYGSFTVAAEKLYLTQPFVSKSIAHLEEELGLYLFVRGNRRFQITPAGRRLYQEWKVMMQHFENSLISAHSIQSGLTDKLQIGLGALSQENNILIQNLKKTRESKPGLDIFVEYDNLTSLVDSVINGNLDLAVVSAHLLPVIRGTNLSWKTIIESCLSIYVHRSNPLFYRENLAFEDLKLEKFIVFSSDSDDSYLMLLHRLAEKAHFTPMISCYVPNEMSFKVNLEMGNGIVLADSFSGLESQDIRRFDLPERNGILAIWKPENYRESIQLFLEQFKMP